MILMVAPRYPPAVGGVEWHARMLATELSAQGVAVEVACTDPGERRPSTDVVDGIRVHRFPTVRGDATFFLSPSLGRWLLGRAGDYSLIHAHSYHTPLPALAALASARAEIPLVVTPHFHGTGHTPRREALHVPYRVVAGWMLRRADAIVCVSDAERRSLDARFRVRRGKVMVIPNGVDLEELMAATPLHGREERRTVLAVGRLEPYKGMERLVRSAALLPSDTDLVIVGDGSARGAVLAAAGQAGLGARFRWFARLSREELLAWYRTADVFVSLSKQEAFGITLLEAAVAGARVVASDIAPHREVAGYLPAGAVSLLTADTTDQAVSEAIAGMATMGPVMGAEDTVPTWRTVADRTHELYRRVLSRSGAAPLGRAASPPPKVL